MLSYIFTNIRLWWGKHKVIYMEINGCMDIFFWQMGRFVLAALRQSAFQKLRLDCNPPVEGGNCFLV